MNAHHRRGRRLLPVLLIAGSLGAPQALAQQAQLPPQLPTSASLTAADREAIATFTNEHGEDLFTGSPAERRRARDALLAALANPQVSVTFRQAYAQQLDTIIDRLISNESDRTRLYLGMRLASELCTERSAQRLLQFIDHDDQAVRFFAIKQLEQVFRVLGASTQPAISAATAMDIARSVGNAIIEEDSPVLLTAQINALSSGTTVTSGDLPPVRFASVREICRAVGQRIDDKVDWECDPLELQAILRAGQTVRSALTDINRPVPLDTAEAARAFGSKLVGAVFQRHQDDTIQLAKIDESIVAEGETIVAQSRQRIATLNNSAEVIPPTNAAGALQAIRNASDDSARKRAIQRFEQEAIELISP